jgi:tRNA threonylcarbamoyladenosine biosynthesis protein TsaB
MMLLAVDCSTRWIGLALYDGVQILSERVWQTANHHTVELAPAVDGLIRYSGIRKSDIQVIGVATGPGSFTSLRIGLALSKGLALALHIPLIGVPTLDVLVRAQPIRDIPLAAVLQAGRGRLGVGWYRVESDHWQFYGEITVQTCEALAQHIHKPTIVCGELSAEERQLLARKRKNVILMTPAQSLRRPSFLAELAWEKWQAGQIDDPVKLAPLYLHIAEPIPEP